MRARDWRTRFDWTALLLAALAFAMRAFRVGHPALRGDEAFTVLFVQQPAGDIVGALATVEPNPPLYYFLLKGWMALAGTSEAAARWPSVLAGVLLVVVGYRLARACGGRTAALAGGLLLAVNPYLLWYAQDARTYSLLGALGLGAAWALWEAARRPRGVGWWAAAGGLGWLALMAHYFAVLPLAAAGLALLLSPHGRARWRSLLLTGLATGLAYLPWALYVLPLLAGHSKGWLGATTLLEALGRTLAAASTYVAGAPKTVARLGAGLAGALAVAALARRRPTGAWYLAAIGFGPPLLLWAISGWRPVFTEQYGFVSLPALTLLAGQGAAALRGKRARWAWISIRLAVLGGWVGAALFVTGHYYFDLAYAKSPDWRGLAQHLTITARAREVVIVNLPDPAFDYYYRGPLPVEVAPTAPLEAVGEAATEAQLARLSASYDHLRLIYKPSPGYDPEGFVGARLDACCELLEDYFYAGFRLRQYDTPAGSLAARQPFEAGFENGARLTGFRLVAAQLRPGETAHLTLFWTTDLRLPESYTVLVHLLAADGFNVLGADGLPAGGRRPSDQWIPGEDVIDAHRIALPPELPPGEYRLAIGLYRLETGARVGLSTPGSARADEALLPTTIVVAGP